MAELDIQVLSKEQKEMMRDINFWYHSLSQAVLEGDLEMVVTATHWLSSASLRLHREVEDDACPNCERKDLDGRRDSTKAADRAAYIIDVTERLDDKMRRGQA